MWALVSRSVSCRRQALSLFAVLSPQHQCLAQGRSKGTLQRGHINSLGSASVLDKQWFALLLAHVWVQFGSVRLNYASRASSTVTQLMGVIISNVCW